MHCGKWTGRLPNRNGFESTTRMENLGFLRDFVTQSRVFGPSVFARYDGLRESESKSKSVVPHLCASRVD